MKLVMVGCIGKKKERSLLFSLEIDRIILSVWTSFSTGDGCCLKLLPTKIVVRYVSLILVSRLIILLVSKSSCIGLLFLLNRSIHDFRDMGLPLCLSFSLISEFKALSMS